MEQALLEYFYGGATITPFFVAFVAGLLSFLSPCTLPLVPLYMAYISGISLAELSSSASEGTKDASNQSFDKQNFANQNFAKQDSLKNDLSQTNPQAPTQNTKSHTEISTKSHSAQNSTQTSASSSTLKSTILNTSTQNPKPLHLSNIRYMIFARSFAFVLGFSLVFILAGIALRSVFFVLDSALLEILAGVVVLIFGLHFLGIFHLKWLYASKKFQLKATYPALKILAPFVLGVSFALGWSPCTGPIFGAIALMASTSTQGFVLLCLYALGFALPFLILAFALERGFELIERFKPHLRKVEILSGILLICVGAFMISGDFSSYLGKISQWIATI